MTEKEILRIFETKKALLNGHFLLSSGLHSDTYLQCALILQYPDLAEKLARLLVKKFLSTYQPINLSTLVTVISPALGGIVIGQEVARALKCRAIFTERENGRMALRRGFQINKGEKVLVVEDVITTGGSTQEVIDVVRNADGQVVGIAALVDRSGGKIRLRLDFGGQAKFKFPLVSLVKLGIENYKPQECPLCKKNIPLVKPGSRVNVGSLHSQETQYQSDTVAFRSKRFRQTK